MRPQSVERARYGWMTTREFAEAIGARREHVARMIRDGWFRSDATPPECINVSRAERPEYRISPAALKRFYRERAA